MTSSTNDQIPHSIPRLVSVPELARRAHTTVKTVSSRLDAAGVLPDGVLVAGLMSARLFAESRLPELCGVISRNV